MGTAKEEIEKAAKGEGCLGKAHPDEPVFVLRAQDALAADLVYKWSVEAQAVGCPWDKVHEARDIAERMEKWHTRKNPD